MKMGSFFGAAAQSGVNTYTTLQRAKIAREQMDIHKAEEARKAAEAAHTAETRQMTDAYVGEWGKRLTEMAPGEVDMQSGEQNMVPRQRKMTSEEQQEFTMGMGQLLATRQKMDPEKFNALRTSIEKERNADVERAIQRIGAGEDPAAVLADAPASLRDRIKPGSVVIEQRPFVFSSALPPMTDRVIRFEDSNGKPQEISTLGYSLSRSTFDKLAEIHGRANEQGARADALRSLSEKREAETRTIEETRAPRVQGIVSRAARDNSQVRLNAMKEDESASRTFLNASRARGEIIRADDTVTTQPARVAALERRGTGGSGGSGGGRSGAGGGAPKLQSTRVDGDGYYVLMMSDGTSRPATDAEGNRIKADRLGEARLAASLARIRQQGDLTGTTPVDEHMRRGAADARTLTRPNAAPAPAPAPKMSEGDARKRAEAAIKAGKDPAAVRAKFKEITGKDL